MAEVTESGKHISDNVSPKENITQACESSSSKKSPRHTPRSGKHSPRHADRKHKHRSDHSSSHKKRNDDGKHSPRHKKDDQDCKDDNPHAQRRSLIRERTPIDKASIPLDIRAKVVSWFVVQAAVLHGDTSKKFNTSKIHRFKPPVMFEEALNWLISSEAEDGTLIFDNESAIIFKQSKFEEFEDLGDDDFY